MKFILNNKLFKDDFKVKNNPNRALKLHELIFNALKRFFQIGTITMVNPLK